MFNPVRLLCCISATRPAVSAARMPSLRAPSVVAKTTMVTKVATISSMRLNPPSPFSRRTSRGESIVIAFCMASFILCAVIVDHANEEMYVMSVRSSYAPPYG